MKDNIPHLPSRVAEAILEKDLDIPLPLVKLVEGREERTIAAGKFMKGVGDHLAGNNHFYLEKLMPYWDLDFRGIDLSEVYMPFEITTLFYNFTNKAVGMPPVDGAGSFEQGKSVIVVTDIKERGMIHVHGYTQNPLYPASQDRWMILPAAAMVWRDNMEDMGGVISKEFFKAQLASPIPGIEYDEYLPAMIEGTHLTEELMASMLSDHLRLVMGFLALSAAKNVPTQVVRPPPKLNKKRIKHGKLPFTEYHVLDLTLGKRQQEAVNAFERVDPENHRAAPRQHLVRGHMRQLQTGVLTYVSPHLRGDPYKGTIHKDYHA